MIVRHLDQERNSRRRVDAPGWNSVRLLLKGDGMGFSFHITTIDAGAELPMHYKNHVEAVYCISGEGSVTDLATGQTHDISPGMMYALDNNDRHVLRGRTQMVMACVFNPPLHGLEVHGADGAYPLDAEAV